MRTHPMPARGASVRPRGFTLIEMLVTMTVLAIMMAIGVPSFRAFVDGQKVKTASHELMTSLVLARSEAVKRNAAVTIAPVTADTWKDGWNVTVVVSGVTTTLAKQQALSGIDITKTPLGDVVYQSNGRPTAGSNFEVTGSSSVKCVKVDASGIPSTQSVACP